MTRALLKLAQQREIMVASVVASTIAACGARAFADVTVIQRSGGAPIVGPSAVATEQGVEVAATGGALSGKALVPWDMVRAVEGTPAVARLDELGAPAEDLWRARIRIDRGDDDLALPLLRAHWDRFAATDGPTTALVAEGMLRATMARGDARGAFEPWIVCLRLGARNVQSRFPNAEPVLDATTGFLPALPPFVPSKDRESLALACDAVSESMAGSEALPVARIFAAIVRATAFDARPDAAASSALLPNGAVLPSADVLSLVLAIIAAENDRERATVVAQFERAVAQAPGYLGAWKLAAIGMNASLRARAIPEGDANRAPALERAALELLAVPASELDPTGLVDCFALEEASRLLRDAGDPTAADQLKNVLEERSRKLAARITTRVSAREVTPEMKSETTPVAGSSSAQIHRSAVNTSQASLSAPRDGYAGRSEP
jgi:hypothetical protein